MRVYVVTIEDGDGYIVHIGAYSSAAKARDAVSAVKKDMLEEGMLDLSEEFDEYYEVEFYYLEVDGEC